MFSWLLDLFATSRRDRHCWVCDADLGRHRMEDMYGSVLGGAFTFGGCSRCMQKRAVTRDHACWFLDLTQADVRPPTDYPFSLCDVDGSRHGRPVTVHVWEGYVPLLEWIKTDDFRHRLVFFRKLKDAYPGAYLGAVLRIPPEETWNRERDEDGDFEWSCGG